MFFQPGDSEGMKRVVSRAWEQPEHTGRLGAQARKEYEAKYTAAANYQQLLEIYQDVIANRLGRNELSSLPILTPPPVSVDAHGSDS